MSHPCQLKKPEPIRRFPPRFFGPLPRTPLPAPGSPYRISPKLPSDFERETPLSIAVSAGNDAVVSLLLNHGAQLNDCVGEQTWTPPTHPAVSALLAGHESTLGTILEWRAQTEGCNLLSGGLINCAVACG